MNWTKIEGQSCLLMFWLKVACTSISICLVVPTLGQSTLDSRSDSLFLRIQSELPEDKTAAAAHLDSVQSLGERLNDCVLQQVGWSLWAKSIASSHADLPLAPWPESCKMAGYHVQYTLGVRYFLDQEYETAKRFWEGALEACSTKDHKIKCMIAIGAVCNELGDKVCALSQFQTAYGLSEPPVHAVLINNLAASQIGFGLEPEALEMLDKALKRDDIDAYTERLLKFNRFHALSSMRDLEAAQMAFDDISEGLDVETLQPSQFRSLVFYALIQSTDAAWIQLKPMLTEALGRWNDDLIFDPGDPAKMLFEAFEEDWNKLQIEDTGSRRWNTVKSLHDNYIAARKAYAKNLLNERNALAVANFNPDPEKLGIATSRIVLWAGLLLVIFGWVGWAIWQKERKRKIKSVSEPKATNVEVLNQVERMARAGENPDLNEIITELKQVELERHQQNLEEITKKLNLNRMESKALGLFIHGSTSKQVALMLDRSVGYIYNLRSNLRKKLEMAENEDFNEWYLARIPNEKKPSSPVTEK